MWPLIKHSDKSKTVAPKAIARRRPAAPAVAQKSQPEPEPEPAPTPPTVAAQPTSNSTSSTVAQPPSRQYDSAPPPDNTHLHQTSTPSATAQDSQPTQPAPAVSTRSSPNAPEPFNVNSATVLLPTPPSTQQSSIVQPSPPAARQSTNVAQYSTSHQPESSTQHVPSEVDASAAPNVHAAILAQALSPSPAPISGSSQPNPAQDSRTDPLPAPVSTVREPTVDTPTPSQPLSEHSGPQSPTRRITSPPPLAGAKRKRNAPSASATHQPTVDNALPRDVVMPDANLDSTQAQESIEAPNDLPAQTAPMAPVALMISPERTRRTGRQPATRSAAAASNAPSVPKPTRTKRQKKAAAKDTPVDVPQENNQASGESQTNEPPAAKTATRKQTRPKKAPKSAVRIVEDEDGNVIDEPDPEQEPVEELEGERQQPKAKPRKPRQPRKPREPKKSKKRQEARAESEEIEDPELHEVDPNAVTMSDLTRDRGFGKQSERETKMASIDWEEVARKRLEAAEAIQAGKGPGTESAPQEDEGTEQEGGGEQASRPRAGGAGPRLRVDQDGNMVVDEASLRIDRQAQAAANAANLEITEEDDLTKRVNQMSWISDRKKDPTERLPFFKMKSDPWSEEETDRFYEALKMFGTDFFIISKMFPPKTRRQIKLKFIREERLDADRINRALSGESTVAMSLDHFAEATGQDIENFKDPRELEEELRVEGEEQREEIAKKKKEIDEAKHQRDIQMAAREKENSQRVEQNRIKKTQRQHRRNAGTYMGNGAL